MFGPPSPRDVERELRRALDGFGALLPSRMPGIRFGASIFGYVHGDFAKVGDLEDLILAARLVLRDAASDLCQECDPSDLLAVEDFCNRHLRSLRPIGGHELRCGARLSLYLRKDDEAAVVAFHSAQREQMVRDEIERQRIAAMHKTFTEPGALLAWWVERRGHDAKLLPKADELKAVSALFAAHPDESRRPIDRQLLDLLKAFVSSFPEAHQKQMLIALMASAFRRAGQGHLADQAERLI